MTTYQNPWHRPGRPEYGPACYETTAIPVRHAGADIFERIPGRVWDVVRGGVCITQRAGLNGAIRAAQSGTESERNEQKRIDLANPGA